MAGLVASAGGGPSKGALGREVIRHMGRRCLNWDYHARCIYQITITLADRSKHLLGELRPELVEAVRAAKGDVSKAAWRGILDRTRSSAEPDRTRSSAEPGRTRSSAEPKTGAGEMRGVVLSEIGRLVVDCWREIPQQWPGVEVLDCQVMPEHFHGVIFVKERQAKTLGNIIGSFKSKSASRAREILDRTRSSAEPDRTRSSAEPDRTRSSAEPDRTRSSAEPDRTRSSAEPVSDGFVFWAKGYVDTILWREGQLRHMIDYDADNPRRLAIKRACPELFRVVRDLKVALPGLGGDSFGHFAALGNPFLLERPLAQAQCSRAHFRYRRVAKPGGGLKIVRDAKGEPEIELTTCDFTARRDELFALAKHGAAIVSPCVSDGERQIAREALAAGYPLVTLQNKGFSKLQKPSGVYFDACAEGRLLMLAPAGWPYQPGEKPMTRFDATALNRLCQWLAGDGAVEINYHGQTPGNVDQLAKDAARVEKA